MAALLTALIPLIQALITGGSLRTILGAVTADQWVAIATQLIQVGPQVAAELPKIVGGLHPTLAPLQPALQTMVDKANATGDANAAAGTMQSWLANNGMGAIQTYPDNANA